MPHSSIDLASLFMQAGPVVKGVFVLLALCSIWCWAIVVGCAFGLWRLRRDLKKAVSGRPSRLWQNVELQGVAAAAQSFVAEDYPARRDRIATAMRSQAQVNIERAQHGLANLAVIASTAPFIGLFGTVWGIMTSFIAISSAKDTSLAVVAPGIAEALLATAVGLAAAIPAAFAYNRFAAGFTLTGRALMRQIDQRLPEIVHGVPSTRDRELS